MLASVCVASLAGLGGAQAASLSAAGGFNALVFGDLNTSGGDTEGRLAVGGTLTVNGSYSVGGCSSPDCTVVGGSSSSQPQSNGARDDLVVGGDLNNSGGSNVNWNQPAGNVVIGGTKAASVVITSSGTGNTVTDGVGDVSGAFDFAAAASTLQSQSQQLASLTPDIGQTGTIVEDSNAFLSLKGTDAGLNVFNLTAAQWNSAGFGKTRVIDVPEGSRVLINVSGATMSALTGSVDFGLDGCANSASCEVASDYASNVMVNYYEATSIIMNGFQHEGSMLAPLAAMSVVGGVINGQAVLGSATSTSGFEFHFRDNNGPDFTDLLDPTPPSSVPLPAAAPLLAAALGGLGLVGRLRRRRRG